MCSEMFGEILLILFLQDISTQRPETRRETFFATNLTTAKSELFFTRIFVLREFFPDILRSFESMETNFIQSLC